jgi:hypothetical protein
MESDLMTRCGRGPDMDWVIDRRSTNPTERRERVAVGEDLEKTLRAPWVVGGL